MVHAVRQLRLLLWKNFILQVRRPIGTAVEILLPIGFIALLIIARVNIENKEKCLSSFDSTDISLFNQMSHKKVMMDKNWNKKQKLEYMNKKLKLAYYPLIKETKELLQLVATSWNVTLSEESLTGSKLGSLKEVLDDAKEFPYDYLGAITFQNVEEGKPLPKVVQYSIRLTHTMAKKYDTTISRAQWFTSYVYPFFQLPGPRKKTFYKSPFIVLQYYIDSAILQKQTGNNLNFATSFVKQFPYPHYKEDTFISIVQSIMPFVFTLAFIYTAVMVVKELVAEKQFRLKESMKMMGLANWVHWTAWFLKTFLFLLSTIILLTILLKAGKIFEFSDGGLVFIFLLLYMLSSIFFLFLISVFFTNSVRAMLTAACVWFGSLGPYLSFSNPEKYEELAVTAKAASCLLPNSCLGIMVQIITRWESSQIGATWSNVRQTTSVDDNFALSQAFGMLILDCFLFMILTWYIESVFPGEYGIPLPFYFPFQPSYWCKSGSGANNNGDDIRLNKIHPNLNCEEEPEGLKVGVSINNLRKVFKSATGKKVAVNGLSLNIYKGQITALLGHNGAGKTTTMSILTGLFPPTSGCATINGKNTVTEIDSIRESLGLCPQHNVLFDKLTVEEHLEFFTALKGIPKAKAKSEIKQMIQDIQLVEKSNSQSCTLSGGMKRKLNCAIALIGGSETVFLDEPTSGMDPYARRATWDLLQKYRENKTIILTTHFMDEADYLGDRIAIMAEGELRCCGSSLFLKKRYGVGYHMTLVKGPEFKENEVTSLVARNIPTAKLVGNVGAEMSYILDQENLKNFKGLFQVLEEQQAEFGIGSFGISITTLEEVFLKVGEGETVGLAVEEEKTDDKENLHVNLERMESKIERDMLLTGCALKLMQFKAMFVKRFLNSKREKKAVITQVALPLLLVLLGLLLSDSYSSRQNDNPLLKISLTKLKSKADTLKAYYGDFSDLPVRQKLLYKEMSEKYYKSVEVMFNDRTSETVKIQNSNLGDNINIQYSSSSMNYNGTIGSDKKNCCNYKFMVLNEKCKAAMTTTADLMSLCGDKPVKFGLGQCMKCAVTSVKPKKGCEDIRAINRINLNDKNTFFQEYVLEDSSKDIKKYFLTHVAGFTIENTTRPLTAWYSNQAWHTVPAVLTAANNILIKVLKNDSTYGIITNNHPLPRNTEEKTKLTTQNGSNLVLVIFLSMAACFVAASFITFIVAEKTSKAKHVQFVSGVDSVCYWSASFCWDYINYLIPAVGIIILFACFDLADYRGELGEVFFVLLMFGFSVLPFVYLISFLFTSSLIAYSFVATFLMVISLAMVIAVFVCRVVEVKEVADILHYIFCLLPTYAFPQALTDIATNRAYRKLCTASPANTRACAQRGTEYRSSSLDFDAPGVGVHCLYMFVEMVVYFLLVMLIEEGFFLSAIFGKTNNNPFVIREGEDGDVQAEQQKVFEMSPEDINNNAVVIKDLTKVYRTTGMMAVDHLSVAIPKAECFGLLGVNGAGKTTTFGMLTGELGISHGTALLHGYDIRQQLKQVQQRVGYCPQFDALVERLTGREMLRMFAQLRGVPSRNIDEVTTAAIECLNLGKWADKMCGDYSGGNKRKLSTAMALVGDPPIVFLDEPTSGMDPGSRRFLWNTLTSVLNTGRSIVLTSHSMEECEALCTRLVIMVNGQFKCLGSIQHLKSRFGQGFTVMMKVSGSKALEYGQQPRTIYEDGEGVNNPNFAPENQNGNLSIPEGNMKGVASAQNIAEATSNAKTFIQQQFPGALLVEDRQGLLQYQIINPDIRWSHMFGTLEDNKAALGIVDYSVSQTSLEQVFINFAKGQHSEDRIVKKGFCSCSCF